MTWLEHAACAGVNPNVFMVSEPEAVAHARTWCNRCPAAEPCLQQALNLGHRAEGVWAGTTLNQRLHIRSRRTARNALGRAS